MPPEVEHSGSYFEQLPVLLHNSSIANSDPCVEFVDFSLVKVFAPIILLHLPDSLYSYVQNISTMVFTNSYSVLQIVYCMGQLDSRLTSKYLRQ